MKERVYNSIKEFIKDKGYSPTMSELCEITGLKSKASAYMWLNKLKTEGYITYEEKNQGQLEY